MTHRRCESKLDVRTSERGAALMLAILVLTTLTLVALYLGSSSSVNRRVASDEVTRSKALRYAEAGVMEAMALIQSGQGPDPAVANAPQKVVQVLLASSGGTAGPDTTLLPTGQPAGQWLPYSTPTSGSGTLTIELRTDPARTQIFKYDKTKNPPIQTTTGSPIYRVRSTGVVGSVSRSVVAELYWSPMTFNLMGGLSAGSNVKFTGNARACGFNHRWDTPVLTGVSGRTGIGGCNEDPTATPPRWERPTESIAGIWTTGDVDLGGAAVATGTPPMSEFSSGFYAGPWEVLGMTESQFYSWVGPRRATMPLTPNGAYYLDNDATHQNASGVWSNTDGTGFLYVDGNLTLHENWRGLIYVEGDLKINGFAWILGAVISRGTPDITFSGGATILYSHDAVEKYVGGGRKPVMLSWREL